MRRNRPGGAAAAAAADHAELQQLGEFSKTCPAIAGEMVPLTAGVSEFAAPPHRAVSALMACAPWPRHAGGSCGWPSPAASTQRRHSMPL